MARVAAGFADILSGSVTLDTTGAKLIVTFATGASGTGFISENKGNGSAIQFDFGQNAAGSPDIIISYWLNPNVGPGHVFTDSPDNYGFYVVAYDDNFDGTVQSTGAVDVNNTIQPGGLDATNPGSLYILGVGTDGAGTAPTCATFTTVDSHAFTSSVNYGSLFAEHYETGNEGSLNPTATFSVSGNVAASLFAFGITGGGGGDTLIAQACM